jgi:hypothetical protein
MEKLIDQAVKDFLDQLGKAQEEFFQDIEQLEEEGLSMEEIMIALGALSIADYFLEDLGMQIAVDSYLSSLNRLLDDLYMFGRITEAQLQALRNAQEASIYTYVNSLGEELRMTTMQGISSNLGMNDLKEFTKRSPNFKDSEIDKNIGDGIATFNRSVVGVMIVGSSPGTKLWYDGPLDKKTRPICRKMLSVGGLTAKQWETNFPGALQDGGGVNCRHRHVGGEATNVRIKKSVRAKQEIVRIDKKRSKKNLSPLKYQTFQEYVQSSQAK